MKNFLVSLKNFFGGGGGEGGVRKNQYRGGIA